MSVRLRACAKVNLTLEVLRKRDDGYHEIATVFQTIDLADELTFERHDALVQTGDDAEAPGEANLVMKAARALQTALGERRGARITLRKQIPVAAGLGGGSSDAATTLIGLCELWGRAVPTSTLAGIAAALGSDVPFFLHGGTALGEGRGERITRLPSLPDHWLVLATPQAAIPGKTGKLYGALTPADYSDGTATQRLVLALRGGQEIVPGHYVNTFERVAARVYPDYVRYCQAFLDAGAPRAHLAGSGPILFTVLERRDDALAMGQRLQERSIAVQIVKTVARPYNRI